MITRRSNPPAGPEEFARSGEFLGVPWSIAFEGEDAVISIGEQRVHVHADGQGGFVSHEVVGRWRDPSQIADVLLRFHPDFSPLASQTAMV